MEPIKIPLVPKWNNNSVCVATPDDGFLYIGWETVSYVSKIEQNQTPVMRIFHIRQSVKCLDCDPDWSETKYFAILAEDNSIQIWDFDENKVKKGHKAHIKPVLGDGESQCLEKVILCYLKNRKVFSIDSSSIIIYCPLSNTYVKRKRVVPVKHEISIVKASSYDENILALGTVRGLVIVLNLKNEKIMYTLRGHETEITSLSWIAMNLNFDKGDNQSTINKRGNSKRKLLKRSEQTIDYSAKEDDDVFDIYGCDYFEQDTFGVPNIAMQKTQTESDEENPDYEKTKDQIENENFNFLEACQSLKSEILSKTDQRDNVMNESISSVENVSQRQVTLADCQQQQKQRQLSGENCDSTSYDSYSNSRQSIDLIGRSSDITSKDDDDEDDDDHRRNNNTCDEKDGLNSSTKTEIFIASGSSESAIWIWNLKTGAAVQHIKMKSSSQNVKVNVCWINENTLIANTRSGELCLWKRKTTDTNKIQFNQDKRKFNHRGVTALCKLRNHEIIWTISTYKEITCEDIKNEIILAKYSCASTGIATIRECPDNMNKLAFGNADRRIGIIDISSLLPTFVKITNFTSRIDSVVLSLNWSPNDRYIVFGTDEGKIGVIDSDKLSFPPITMKPFSGKPVYSVEWWGNKIFACSNEKVAVYEWCGKSKDPHVLGNVTEASSICVRSLYLLVGTQSGFLNIFKRDDENSIDFEKITSTYVAPKYISEIAFNPINKNRFAISSLANKIVIFSLSPDTDVLTNERVLMMNDYSSGNAWVKWSNKNENVLLSCGFDGTVRVWDLSLNTNELIFLKQYQSPMFCGLFSPINENIVICAGKATSIEMFDMTKEKTASFDTKSTYKRSRVKIIGVIQWGRKIRNDCVEGKKNQRTRTRRRKQSSTGELNTTEEIAETLDKLVLNENDEDTTIKKESTVLHLTTKEMNKDSLRILLTVLEDKNENDEIKDASLLLKLFGNRKDIEILLNKELHNHQISNTKSIAHIVIPQLGSNLKEEILKLVQNKNLTAQHVALAPTISYQFWKDCCLAYANQLVELGLSLQATPYYLACHQLNECIDELLKNHQYREALIIAKIYKEHDENLFKKITESWIDHLNNNGNLESAALICALSKQYEKCKYILLKRRNISEEHKKILEVLEEKTGKQ